MASLRRKLSSLTNLIAWKAPRMEKKDLYLATSIEQLNKNVNTSGKISPRLELLCRLSDSLYNKADEIYKTAPIDEELTYIICLRYSSLVERIRLKEKDEAFHKSRFGKPLDYINNIKYKCEQSLIQRYDALAKLPVVEVVSPEPPEAKKKEVEITFNVGGDMFISSEALYKLMKADKIKVLIIDIRTKDEFSESQIRHTDVLNIPNSLITKGLSTNTLKQKLPEESIEKFEARAQYDYIVIMDLDTPSINYSGSKIEDLRSILVDWDLEEHIGLIVVLDGGIRAIAETHPSVINNLLFVATRIFNEFDDGFLGDIQYPELLADTPEPVELVPVEIIESIKRLEVPSDVPPLDLAGLSEGTNTSSETSLDQNIPEESYQELCMQILMQVEFAMKIETEIFNLVKKRFMMKKSILESPDTAKEGYLQLQKIATDVSKSESEKITIRERKSLLEKKITQVPKEVPTEEMAQISDKTIAIERKILLKCQSRKKIEEKEVAVDKEMRDRGLISYWEPTIELKKSNSRPDIDRRLKPTDNKVLELIPELNTSCRGTGLIGLYNIQNTCYLNSLVQCLRFCPPFMVHLTTVEPPPKTSHSSKITLFLVQLMVKLWNSNCNYITPTNFFNEIVRVDNKNIGYGLGRHEDVQELYMFLMKYIHIEMCAPIILEPNREYTSRLLDWTKNFNDLESFATRMFYHQLELTTLCPKCEKSVAKFEYGNTIFVNIDSKVERLDIVEEMQNFLTVKPGEKTGKKFCNDCEVETELTKRITYYPTILAVNLIRYYYDLTSKIVRRSNIECLLNQEIYFGSCRYELKAVSLHHGDRDFGHYTALCYHPFQNKWVEFNDTRWTYSDLDTPTNRVKCYMLFYTITHNPSEVNKKFFNL